MLVKYVHAAGADPGFLEFWGFICICILLFVCFVALRPKSTAMVIGGRSVHLTTLFPGQASTSG